MGVMLQTDAQNQRLCLHNVLVINKETNNDTWDNKLTTWSHESNESLFITNIIQTIFFVKQNIKKTSENNFSGDKIQPSLKKNESYENAKQGKKDSKGLTR